MNDENEELPGSVSNQNNEEAEPGHAGGAENCSPAGEDKKSGGDSEGEAGEGSQSTGNPDSAG